MPSKTDIHLNNILRAIRDVNRLIIKEKNNDVLIQETCNILVNSRGYFNVWIALLDENKNIIQYSSAGLGENSKLILQLLSNKNEKACCTIALNTEKPKSTDNPIYDCQDCPLSQKYNGRGSYAIPLKYGNKVTGLLVASVPKEFTHLKEEAILLQEVAEDLSFALNSNTANEQLKIAENNLEQERFLMDSLMDSLPDNVYFKNEKSEFIRINKSMSNFFGLNSPNDAIGKTDFDFFTIEHAQPAFEDEQEILKTGNPIVGAEEKETWPDGRITWVSTTKMPLKDKQGKTIGTFGISKDITQQKNAEIALQKSEEKFKMIVQNQGEGIGITNTNEIFTFANPAAHEIFGVKQGTLVNQSLIKFLSKETIEFVKRETKKRKKGESSKYEIEIIQPSGQIRNILVTTTPYKNEDGTFIGTFGVFRDITERIKTSKKLQLQKEQFELAVRGANDGIWDWNLVTNELYLSPRWKEQLGYKNEELLNNFNSFEKQIHPDDLERMQKYIDSYLKGQISNFNLEVRMRHKNGNYLWIHSKGEALRDKNGIPYRMAGSHSDITERKVAEEKNKSAFTRLNNIMNSVQAGIILIRKKDKIIVDVNPAAENILRIKRKKIIDQHYNKHIQLKVANKQVDIETKLSEQNLECQIEKTSGKIITLLKNHSEVEIDGEGYWLESFVDISKQKEAEADLIEARIHADLANKAKSEFLANMSHEIRTPMNSILGFSEILLNSLTENKYKEYLKTIINSGKTLLSLINDILDLSKIESGKLELVPDPVDISIIINEIGQVFSQKIKEKNLNYLCEIDDNFPKNILIDEIRFRQILFNILGNAVKFTSKGFIKTELKVLNAENGFLDFSISVTDSGIGIAKSDRDRIFESFSQQAGHAARNYEGTGLGLAISKRLCEIMNGKIELNSELGKGSTFSITFSNIEYSFEPVNQDESYTWTYKNIVFDPAKILVVDDIALNRNLICSFFEDSNIKFREAQNGETAISLTKDFHPDLILMDIRMPGITGYEATNILKKHKKTKSIPVIALTASTMKSETEKINQLFDGYLKKPVQKNALIKELKKHLKYKEIIVNDKVSEQNKKDSSQEIDSSIKDEFQTNFFVKIDELKEMIIVDDLDPFIGSLSDFANKNNISFLKNKVEEFNSYVEEFDFEGISNCLTDIKHYFK